MPISPEITDLVDRLNQELNETEQNAIEGLNLVRQRTKVISFSR